AQPQATLINHVAAAVPAAQPYTLPATPHLTSLCRVIVHCCLIVMDCPATQNIPLSDKSRSTLRPYLWVI
ncbi:MAG: hypothetical protein IJ160_06575, partial [Muribaculaceae bacterium]|nr:hypothetical protein [Muribaculaceae bacterium]